MRKDFDEFLESLATDEAIEDLNRLFGECVGKLGETQEDGTTKLDLNDAFMGITSYAVHVSRLELRKYHEWINS